MAKQGQRVVWCEPCDMWFKAPAPYTGVCPRCGSPVKVFKCTRCGHEWKPRRPMRIPGSCPKCCSPYAFYTRTKDRKGE